MLKDPEYKFYLELLRAYIDSTDDALFVLCDEMKFLMCNHAGENYFGVSEDILTKHNQRIPVTELFTDAPTRELFMRVYPRALAGEAIKFESYMKPENADSRWIEFNLNKVAVENAPMVTVVARDITERKKFETELQDQKAILESLVMERTNELIRANKQKDKLFSIIAHDLKNPLSPVLGYAELIMMQADELSSEKLADYARKIHDSGKQTIGLLTDLLDWSRLQLDVLSLSKKPINLKDVAQNCIDKLSGSANVKNIVLRNRIPSTQVSADAFILETVIRNLTSNAIKFTPSGGSVTLELEQNKGNNVILVKDTGVGMSNDDLAAALSAHNFTSNKGTSGEEGTGLGLPLCISMAEKHGGSIDATSEPGKGTTFRFLLEKQPYK